eukprot:Blabericola_migrator_1__2538@NODE_1715_length_3936_cov_19_202895_g1110_i0_p4_GENE_NODE_1715_length_3936_cov_19_202895_g1110_i0NODE_1715_length_3936_cov_19_202895_g1110_i0_p4_ORF_typecomplete_len102_score2_15_NODE_1715_length_3936_cov_19_202895_g1110_i036083913
MITSLYSLGIHNKPKNPLGSPVPSLQTYPHSWFLGSLDSRPSERLYEVTLLDYMACQLLCDDTSSISHRCFTEHKRLTRQLLFGGPTSSWFGLQFSLTGPG